MAAAAAWRLRWTSAAVGGYSSSRSPPRDRPLMQALRHSVLQPGLLSCTLSDGYRRQREWRTA